MYVNVYVFLLLSSQVFFHNDCYKHFQDVVVFLPLCIIPAIVECEKSSACDKMNFLLLVILFISWQYAALFYLSWKYFHYSTNILALLD